MRHRLAAPSSDTRVTAATTTVHGSCSAQPGERDASAGPRWPCSRRPSERVIRYDVTGLAPPVDRRLPGHDGTGRRGCAPTAATGAEGGDRVGGAERRGVARIEPDVVDPPAVERVVASHPRSGRPPARAVRPARRGRPGSSRSPWLSPPKPVKPGVGAADDVPGRAVDPRQPGHARPGAVDQLLDRAPGRRRSTPSSSYSSHVGVVEVQVGRHRSTLGTVNACAGHGPRGVVVRDRGPGRARRATPARSTA